MNPKGITPLYDRILVEIIEQEEKTKGGIVLPETAKSKPQLGRVISVGEGRLLENNKIFPLVVKPEDVVFFNSYSGVNVNDKYLLLKEDEVLGIVEESE